jgi:hypothetical protein
MKLKLTYAFLFLIVAVITSSCLKTDKIPSTNTNTPSGTFTGQFLYIHLNSVTGATDTVSANLQLTMETSTGFAITGDTSVVHAGSHGAYIINSVFTGIDFIDATAPTSGTPAKHHLSGIYAYTFDGSNLQIVGYGAQDTTAAVYNMKRVAN